MNKDIDVQLYNRVKKKMRDFDIPIIGRMRSYSDDEDDREMYTALLYDHEDYKQSSTIAAMLINNDTEQRSREVL